MIYYLDMFEEERFSIGKFGDTYRDYMRRVPRSKFVLGLFRAIRGTPNWRVKPTD